jgi:hypothetical protein
MGEFHVMLHRMKLDLYTKSLLTVIALLLAVIAYNVSVRPVNAAQAAGQFAGVQYASTVGTVSFFNPNNGDVFIYSADPNSPKGGTLLAAWKFTQLGVNAQKPKSGAGGKDSWQNP